MNSASDFKGFTGLDNLLNYVKDENLSDVEDYKVDPDESEKSGENSVMDNTVYVKQELIEQSYAIERNQDEILKKIFIKSEVEDKDYIDCSYVANEEDKFEFVCQACGFKCEEKNDIKVHMKQTHVKLKILYTCMICNRKCLYRTFSYKLFCQHVNNIHLKINFFTCEKCDYKVVRVYDLKRHIARMHSTDEEKIKCEHCEFATEHEFNLKLHVKKEHRKGMLKCELCDYETYENFRLKIHFDSVHLKQRRFECRDCDYKSYQGSSLRAHVKIVHLKQKEYECEECGKSFGFNSDLKRHVKFRHDRKKAKTEKELSLKCSHCDYVFKRRHHLKTHTELVHSNAEDIKCNQCNFSSKYKYNVKLHINRVHLKMTVSCPECEYVTFGNTQLKRHFKAIHVEGGTPRRKKNLEGLESTKMPKKSKKQCELCPFECDKLKDLKAHFEEMHEDSGDIEPTDVNRDGGKTEEIKEEHDRFLQFCEGALWGLDDEKIL